MRTCGDGAGSYYTLNTLLPMNKQSKQHAITALRRNASTCSTVKKSQWSALGKQAMSEDGGICWHINRPGCDLSQHSYDRELWMSFHLATVPVFDATRNA